MRKKVKKPNIISIRITDAEMENVQRLMAETNTRASDLMRAAFSLYRNQWEQSKAA
ncbi:MAG: hypothetical protein HYS23_13090 [Geobacter sp.]|nr:hypothetical protein [Geobacter sp.]